VVVDVEVDVGSDVEVDVLVVDELVVALSGDRPVAPPEMPRPTATATTTAPRPPRMARRGWRRAARWAGLIVPP